MAQTKGVLLVGTRKGAFFFRCGAGRDSWSLDEPASFGNIVHHVVADPRDRSRMLMASKTGHLGPTVFRSPDAGATWTEAARPPAFPKAREGEKGRVVDHVFWLTPGHASQPGVWYAGTSPQGLFRSTDHGETWEPVTGFHDDPMFLTWVGRPEDAPPDGARLHSIQIDPRDPNHLYFGMSAGGVFETTNGGAKWAPLNKGSVIDFGPVTEPEFGQDPHCVRLHPLMPDRLYQQNHCGIYRMERAEGRWIRVGDNMPRHIRDIGFPMTLHPRDPDTAWVFPMDGTAVWPRTSPDGKPAVYATHDAGTTWIRQDNGLPREHAWLTVKRQAMTADERDPVGLYFGTTSGEVWASRDEGESWTPIASHLPHVYSTEFVELE